MIKFYFFLFLIVKFINCELCPPIFGEFECPLNYNCLLGVCKSQIEQSPPQNCDEIKCRLESICLLGRCYPLEGMPCGRNILVGEKTAYSIVSDCGYNGKCINGKCLIDIKNSLECINVVCEEGEFCRDGKCQKFYDIFCFSDYDCGPLISPHATSTLLECKTNKCVLRNESDVAFYKNSDLRCEPGQIIQNNKCVSSEGCAQLVCNADEVCLSGSCVPSIQECGDTISVTGEIVTCPKNMLCREGVCINNPCNDRCLPDHVCINNGECRLIQGLICQENCPLPFQCINGACVKDECHQKVCQIGERCENGFCIHIDGRSCKTKEKDCGEAFECIESKCQDKILFRNLDNFAQLENKSTLKRIRS